MQGKGLIRFFLIFMLILSVYTFALFIPTKNVEKRADKHAADKTTAIADEGEKSVMYRQARQQFLDSMSNETVLNLGFKKFTYLDLVRQQLALGLDLKGGLSVVMQVDLKDLIIQLSDDSKNDAFVKALDKASSAQSQSQSDYITLFKDAFEETASGERLAPIFANGLPDDVTYETSNNEVASILREKANETVGLTFKRLKQRIDKFGVTQPNVTLDENTDRIFVELPGVDNPKRAIELLQASAKLEFFDVYLPAELFARINKGDKALKEKEEILAKKDTTNSIDSTGIDTLPASIAGPIFSKLQYNTSPAQAGTPAFIGQASVKDMQKISDLLASPEVKIPKDVRFLWSNKPITDQDGKRLDIIELYAIKTESGEAPMEGDVVTDARADLDARTNSYEVSLTMNATGRQVWSKMTTKNAPKKRQIAIVLDNEVVSAPAVQSAINDGRTQISGNFSPQEAQDLANILQVGKLPAKTQIIQSDIVGPSLGADNIRTSLTALGIGMVILLAFMAFYYGTGGMIAIVALLLNLLFVVASLASLGTVLTLSGIAGVILTIGMAVDANVIIFERIREELHGGKAMKAAVKDGFQASYSAIVDANVTTILTAFVLFYFGLGPIKGFAAVLIIGVISSLFTAVLVGRVLIEWWMSKEKGIAFSTKMSDGAFTNWNFDFIKARRLSYMISGSIIVAGLIAFATIGFDLGVDFKGGYSYAVQFEKPVDVDQIRANMTKQFGDAPVVKAFGGNNTYEVTTSHMVKSNDPNADAIVLQKLYNGVIETLGESSMTLEQFENREAKTFLTRSVKIGPTIADDITQSAFYAAIFALLLIFLYIFVRFRKWQYSLGAVAALFHDVLIVLSIFSIGKLFLPFSLEIDQAFIAAILTVIGYSINDTVVVFDRIREFINAYTNKEKKEVFNLAINNTISRTIITSVTTLFVVAMLFVFSGGSIKGFAFALLIGIFVGTYSSVFIATPIVFDATDEISPKEVGKTTKYSGRAIEGKA